MNVRSSDEGGASRLLDLLLVVLGWPLMALMLIPAAVFSGLNLAWVAVADAVERWTPSWRLPAPPQRPPITPNTAPRLTQKGTLVARGLWEEVGGYLAFSPDSTLVAAGGDNRTATVWNVRTGRRVARLHRRRIFRENSWAENVLAGAEPPAVWRVAFAGPRTLVAQIGDGTVTVWDVATGRERYTLRGQYTAEQGGPAGVLVDTGEHGPLAERPHGGDLAFALSPGGEALLVTPALPAGFAFELRETQTGRLLRASDHRGPRVPKGWRTEATSAQFSPDGVRFALRLTDLRKRWVEVHRTDGDADPVSLPDGWPVAFAPDGTALAGACGTEIRVWDAATGQERWRSRDDLGYVRDLYVSPAGDILVAETTRGGGDGAQRLLRVWEAATGRELGLLVGGDRGGVVSMAFSPDGQLLAVARSQSLEVWDAGAARLLYRSSHPSEDSERVWVRGQCAFLPDGTLIGLSTLRGIGIWHVPR